MRWPWVRRSRLEDLERRLEDTRRQVEQSLRVVDAGLVPLLLEPVPNPPMLTLVWQGQKVLAVWPSEDARWAGIERDQLEPVLAHFNASRGKR